MAFQDDEFKDERINHLMRVLGGLIGESLPPDYGFCLMMFGYHDNRMFYVCSANRDDMVKTLAEFIEKISTTH